MNGFDKAMQVFRKPPVRPDKQPMPGVHRSGRQFTRGDWKHDELYLWLQELRAYSRHELHYDPRELHYVPHDAPPPPVCMETVEVPALVFERMLRKQAACDEALTLAVEALEFAHNRDMARLSVLRELDEANKVTRNT